MQTGASSQLRGIEAEPSSGGEPQCGRFRAIIAPMLMAIALALFTFVLFWPAVRNGFVEIDDPVYVSSNDIVKQGLSAAGVREAFTEVFGYWNPLTWLSLELDAQIFGPGPFGFHLTSVLLHACNAGLLLIALRLLSGSTWRAASAAALFALHPLRVESVAWVAERKTVLFAFFGLLALIAYALFARRRMAGRGRQAWPWYIATIFFHTLTLLCKPTLVTLPALLLLLDYWPLGRVSWSRKPLASLLIEKIPFFILSGAMAIVVPITMSQSGANAGLQLFDLQYRLANTTVAYARYVINVFAINRLTYDYPLQPHGWPAATVAACAALLLAISALAMIWRRRRPWLLFGWLWFLIAMLPTSGLWQTTEAAMADRYTYFPMIGLIVMAVWSLPPTREDEPSSRLSSRRRTIAVTSAMLAALVLVLSFFTDRQIGFWRDTFTLARRAVDVTHNNYDADYLLALEYLKRGDKTDALRYTAEAVSIEPDTPDAQNVCGDLLCEAGKFAEASEHYQLAARLDPDRAGLHTQWLYKTGAAMAGHGQHAEAIVHFRAALLVDPTFVPAQLDLGAELERAGDLKAAAAHFAQAMQLDPEEPEGFWRLGGVLLKLGDYAKSAQCSAKALALDPNSVDALYNLAAAEIHLDQKPSAREHLQAAHRLAPNDARITQKLAEL